MAEVHFRKKCISRTSRAATGRILLVVSVACKHLCERLTATVAGSVAAQTSLRTCCSVTPVGFFGSSNTLPLSAADEADFLLTRHCQPLLLLELPFAPPCVTPSRQSAMGCLSEKYSKNIVFPKNREETPITEL